MKFKTGDLVEVSPTNIDTEKRLGLVLQGWATSSYKDSACTIPYYMYEVLVSGVRHLRIEGALSAVTEE